MYEYVEKQCICLPSIGYVKVTASRYPLSQLKGNWRIVTIVKVLNFQMYLNKNIKTYPRTHQYTHPLLLHACDKFSLKKSTSCFHYPAKLAEVDAVIQQFLVHSYQIRYRKTDVECTIAEVT
jgi:hypothetical protein